MTPPLLILTALLAQDSPATAPPRSRASDELAKQIKRLKELSSPERDALAESIRKEFTTEANPLLPAGDIDLVRYAALAPVDQARVTARHFFADLLAADTQGLVAQSGLPFMLEERRLERADELRTEWARSLRGKRTDLLVLYDVQVLTPAEMEKQFGPAPRRLASWPWRAPGTLIAVGNLSGRAMVLLLRQAGIAYQVIAFHD